MSISKKIAVLFFISFVLMSIIGFWIDNINTKRIDDLIKEKYLKIANELLLNIDNKNKIEQLLQQYGLKPLKTPTLNNEILYEKNTPLVLFPFKKSLLKMSLFYISIF